MSPRPCENFVSAPRATSGPGPWFEDLRERDLIVLCALLKAQPDENHSVLVRNLGLPGTAIGWGRTLGALSRRGLVEGHYPSVESAGVPMVWRLTPAGREAANRPVEPREGMVTVYDSDGKYVGCMGAETWQQLLDSEAANSQASAEQ